MQRRSCRVKRWRRSGSAISRSSPSRRSLDRRANGLCARDAGREFRWQDPARGARLDRRQRCCQRRGVLRDQCRHPLEPVGIAAVLGHQVAQALLTLRATRPGPCDTRRAAADRRRPGRCAGRGRWHPHKSPIRSSSRIASSERSVSALDLRQITQRNECDHAVGDNGQQGKQQECQPRHVAARVNSRPDRVAHCATDD